MIEHFGLTDRFKVIGAASDDYLLHTKADVIASVLDRLGLVGGDEIVMVGDRRFDVEGAAAHGIDTIGVLWGYGSLRRAGGGRAPGRSPSIRRGDAPRRRADRLA